LLHAAEVDFVRFDPSHCFPPFFRRFFDHKFSERDNVLTLFCFSGRISRHFRTRTCK
jgi:hypothetical protein